MKTIKDTLKHVKRNVELELHKSEAYSYLPDIYKNLEQMINTLETDGQKLEFRKKKFRAIGRLVTESINFAESELGIKILKVSEDYLDYSKN